MLDVQSMLNFSFPPKYISKFNSEALKMLRVSNPTNKPTVVS